MNVTTALAAGMKALPNGESSFAQTQAMWRFLNNDRVGIDQLSQPLLSLAYEQVDKQCVNYVLATHDWSRINYKNHSSKEDRTQMSHKHDLGYDLHGSLLVSDRSGATLVSPIVYMTTKEGMYCSTHQEIQPKKSHLDALTDKIEWLEEQGFSKKIIHIVDRESDSAGHLRLWDSRKRNWLVRVKESSIVEYQGFDVRISDTLSELVYKSYDDVDYKGKKEKNEVASTEVILSRKAKGKSAKDHPEEPLKVKLLVSRVRSKETGELLAQWCLLSNVMDVSDNQLATWYYYRWRIESYFKVLKQAGHQLESWGQETGKAIFKRLLIVAQSCALAWQIMHAQGEKAEAFKSFLVKLSGRQMKWKQPVTLPALLDGLFKLFMLLEVLELYSMDEIKEMAEMLPFAKRA